MGRHQKRSMFRVPYEFISKEIYPKLTYWAIKANSFHERINFSYLPLQWSLQEFSACYCSPKFHRSDNVFFFQFFVSLKQAEKEKSEALDKYLRIGIILPSLLYGHLF